MSIKGLDAILVALALIPSRCQSLMTMRTFGRRPDEVKKYIAESSVARLIREWASWIVAFIYILVTTELACQRSVMLIGAVVILVLLGSVYLMYSHYTKPRNLDEIKEAHLFMAVPLTTRWPRWSAFNTIVVLGIVADLVLVAMRLYQSA